jgi:hypothetical protein
MLFEHTNHNRFSKTTPKPPSLSQIKRTTQLQRKLPIPESYPLCEHGNTAQAGCTDLASDLHAPDSSVNGWGGWEDEGQDVHKPVTSNSLVLSRLDGGGIIPTQT